MSYKRLAQSISKVSSNDITQQTVVFSDQTPGHLCADPILNTDSVTGMKSTDTSLGKFLSRPQKIHEFEWNGTQTGSINPINPWLLLASNNFVKEKMDNFSLFKANLHLKFLINGNQFHYGRMLALYEPLAGTKEIKILGSGNYLNKSSLPHIILDPNSSQTPEMILPFCWFTDYMQIAGNQYLSLQYANLGELGFHVYSPLRQANEPVAGSVVPVTISIYAWFEDVDIRIPTTTRIEFQSDDTADEYIADGPISAPASALAVAASYLTSIPVISPFARATQIMANATAHSASLFGLSKPVNLELSNLMTPRFYDKFGIPDGRFNGNKLTVDPKQELSIGSAPTSRNVDTDELSLAYLCSRENLTRSETWTYESSQGDLIFEMPVTPCTPWANSFPAYYFNILGLVSLGFNWWRGTLKYRIQIVSSTFHRGRLLITYHPTRDPSLPGDLTDYTNVLYSKIVDISEVTDFVMEVPWCQNVAYKSTNIIPTTQDTSSFALLKSCNGSLRFTVLNELVAPAATDVNISVWLSAADDFKLRDPSTETWFSKMSYSSTILAESDDTQYMIIPQSATSEVNDPMECCDIIQTFNDTSVGTDADSMYFGEQILSVRQLMKRPTYYRTASNTMSLTTSLFMYRLPLYPYLGGYTGLNTPLPQAEWTPSAIGFKPETSFFAILGPCFTTRRGSMRWHISNRSHKEGSGNLIVRREAAPASEIDENPILFPASTTVPRDVNYMTLVYGNTNSGAALYNMQVFNDVEVEIPDYMPTKFHVAANKTSKEIFIDGRIYRPQNLMVSAAYSPKAAATSTIYTVDNFYSIGEDFSFSWLMGVPPLYTIATVNN
jgi:hypothetical protein